MELIFLSTMFSLVRYSDGILFVLDEKHTKISHTAVSARYRDGVYYSCQLLYNHEDVIYLQAMQNQLLERCLVNINKCKDFNVIGGSVASTNNDHNKKDENYFLPPGRADGEKYQHYQPSAFDHQDFLLPTGDDYQNYPPFTQDEDKNYLPSTGDRNYQPSTGDDQDYLPSTYDEDRYCMFGTNGEEQSYQQPKHDKEGKNYQSSTDGDDEAYQQPTNDDDDQDYQQPTDDDDQDYQQPTDDDENYQSPTDDEDQDYLSSTYDQVRDDMSGIDDEEKSYQQPTHHEDKNYQLLKDDDKIISLPQMMKIMVICRLQMKEAQNFGIKKEESFRHV